MHLTTPMGMSGVLIVQRRMWERVGITPESGDLTPGIWHLTTCYFCFWSNLPTQERFGCALILLCIFKKVDSMFLGTFYEWAGWEVPADERACRHRRCWVPPRTLGYVRHLPCPHLVFLPRELSIVLWPFKRLRCLFKSTSLLIHLIKVDLQLTSMTSSIIYTCNTIVSNILNDTAGTFHLAFEIFTMLVGRPLSFLGLPSRIHLHHDQADKKSKYDATDGIEEDNHCAWTETSEPATRVLWIKQNSFQHLPWFTSFPKAPVKVIVFRQLTPHSWCVAQRQVLQEDKIHTLHLCYLVIRILQEEDSFSPHQIFLAHCTHCSKSEVGLDSERCSSCIDPVTCQIQTPENVTQTQIHRFTSCVNPYSHWGLMSVLIVSLIFFSSTRWVILWC